MQTAVINGIPANSVADYCRLDEENANCASRFEVEVALNNTIFLYGFDVLLSESRFLSEWLYEKKGSKERLIFTRNIAAETFDVINFPNNSALNERLRIYADDIKSGMNLIIPYYPFRIILERKL